ncbi:hypothetical protein EIN_247190 [Entamoeba invadens IP1]|uniref:Uncharacterized protein n=1 Tax=Entamoeba invadens IP1 TaxID=370355 RepID=A0A0A1UE03_ENTIV|nr:hypothetical protein EIN_247190 [Entamoeba invadens IP1]ELP94825.1 hypothetical protein EIN_247190 [Entamoeba invadens IP1]|eukprot:XP_004261596.1 hypothetical protein EIN_247190 [Entamoeba invadens IP1]
MTHKPESERMSSLLFNLIHSQIQNNPNTVAFTFVLNTESHTAEIITTSKFTTLLNQELIKNLTQISIAAIEAPQTEKEAIEKLRVFKIPLPPPTECPASACSVRKMEEDSQKPPTPLNSRRMTPVTSVGRYTPRMSPATPINPNYMQLDPEILIQKPPLSRSPPSRKTRKTLTPHHQSMYQSIQTTIDDSTKQRLINVLSKPIL